MAAAAGGGTGTVTVPAGSGLDAPPSSGVSEPVLARVPVPPSQPRPPRGGGWPLLSHFAYGPLPDSASTARARTRTVLTEWDVKPAELVLGDVLLVITELLTNALVASGALPGPAQVRVWLCCDRMRLLVAVADQSFEPPVFVPPSDEALSGRGLRVVDALSCSWGWFPATTPGLAKVVWASLSLGPAAATSGRAGPGQGAAAAAGPAGPGGRGM
jgi:hypothetical protein